MSPDQPTGPVAAARAGDRLAEALAVHADAELLVDAGAVAAAYDRMAAELQPRIEGRAPIVLCVMNGGLVPAAALLERLATPLELDYLHATRYRGRTTGGQLDWLARPHLELRERVVLIVDDIFDEGYTLASVADHCRAAGAEEVLSAVLVDKRHERKVAGFAPDVVGLTCPDRYVYGAGMDYKGFFRNLRTIHAVRGR